jgi:hypothetical protein
LGKNTPAIRTLPDDQNNLRSPGFSLIEAENLAQFFDSHAATLFDEDNASLYLEAHVAPCSGRVVAYPDGTAFLGDYFRIAGHPPRTQKSGNFCVRTVQYVSRRLSTLPGIETVRSA